MHDEDIPVWDDEIEAVPELTSHALGEMAHRGTEAFELTTHPAFVTAVDGISRSLYAQWAATGIMEAEKREKIYAQLLGLQAISGALAEAVRRGGDAAEVLATAHPYDT